MLETVGGGRVLDEALAMARVHHGGAPDVLWHEPGVNPAALAALRRRGHDLRQVPALGHVNAFFCPKGLKDEPGSCGVANDPRGFGLAYVAQ
jgi:gamma-glutamyltranspeptidase/glutathione hydrolase